MLRGGARVVSADGTASRAPTPVCRVTPLCHGLPPFVIVGEGGIRWDQEKSKFSPMVWYDGKTGEVRQSQSITELREGLKSSEA